MEFFTFSYNILKNQSNIPLQNKSHCYYFLIESSIIYHIMKFSSSLVVSGILSIAASDAFDTNKLADQAKINLDNTPISQQRQQRKAGFEIFRSSTTATATTQKQQHTVQVYDLSTPTSSSNLRGSSVQTIDPAAVLSLNNHNLKTKEEKEEQSDILGVNKNRLSRPLNAYNDHEYVFNKPQSANDISITDNAEINIGAGDADDGNRALQIVPPPGLSNPDLTTTALASSPLSGCVDIEMTLTTDGGGNNLNFQLYDVEQMIDGVLNQTIISAFYGDMESFTDYTPTNPICVDPNGCYRAVLFDQQGDGFVGSGGLVIQYGGTEVMNVGPGDPGFLCTGCITPGTIYYTVDFGNCATTTTTPSPTTAPIPGGATQPPSFSGTTSPTTVLISGGSTQPPSLSGTTAPTTVLVSGGSTQPPSLSGTTAPTTVLVTGGSTQPPSLSGTTAPTTAPVSGGATQPPSLSGTTSPTTAPVSSGATQTPSSEAAPESCYDLNLSLEINSNPQDYLLIIATEDLQTTEFTQNTFTADTTYSATENEICLDPTGCYFIFLYDDDDTNTGFTTGGLELTIEGTTILSIGSSDPGLPCADCTGTSVVFWGVRFGSCSPSTSAPVSPTTSVPALSPTPAPVSPTTTTASPTTAPVSPTTSVPALSPTPAPVSPTTSTASPTTAPVPSPTPAPVAPGGTCMRFSASLQVDQDPEDYKIILFAMSDFDDNGVIDSPIVTGNTFEAGGVYGVTEADFNTCLDPNECYAFIIYDSGLDGFVGSGGITVIANGSNILDVPADDTSSWQPLTDGSLWFAIATFGNCAEM